MSLREFAARNKSLSTAGAILVVGAIALMIYQMMPEKPSKYEWYSTDDGASWFRDSIRRAPPYTKDGKPAVLAKIYACNGKKFVAWMQRYTPVAQEKVQAFYESEDKGEKPDPNVLLPYNQMIEHKRPGDKAWTADGGAFVSMQMVKCPDGSPEDPVIVYP